MITLNDIRLTVQSYIPYDTGFMYVNGTRFSEDTYKYSAIYDGNAVPYIPYQEYGFKHWISGQKITVNQYFIQNDTVNALDYLINSATPNQYERIMAFNKRTVQARNNQLSQGVLQTLKGNEMR